jgi:murein DD-endopeptidase MepM/ murein hydrolase activator NlpD
MRILILLALVGVDLAGPLKYDKSGVELDGKRTAWKDIQSIAEADAANAGEAYAAEIAKPENAGAIEQLATDSWNKEAIKRLKPVLDKRPPKTALRPPFEGRWKAMPDATGHHAQKCFALHAIDFVRVDEKGKLSTGSGKSLGDYLGYDQPVLAAADGEVIQVEDRFDDLPPGQLGKFDQANFVTVKHSDEEFTFYGHIRKGSAAVRAGDKVAKGKTLAHVGNSGASGTPHLHFTMLTPIRGGWVSVPWRLHGFTLVEAGGTACSIDAKQARPQEGWVLVTK